MRNFACWIDSFMEYTADLPSPEPFRLWSAITTISGALERKVWTVTFHTRLLYPNLFVILVAPPGVGKSIVTDIVRDLWLTLPNHNVGESSLTEASLIDAMSAKPRTMISEKTEHTSLNFFSLLVCVNEFAVFVKDYNSNIIPILTDLYDGKGYSERRRTHKGGEPIVMDRTNLVLLSATTTDDILNLPDSAWERGFLSRTMLIYDRKKKTARLFPDGPAPDKDFMLRLRADLKEISVVAGQMTFTEDAKAYIEDLNLNGFDPVPDHARFKNYSTRRIAHLLKLSTISAISTSSDRIIHQHHVERAVGWLLAAEKNMPGIFGDALGNDDMRRALDIWYEVNKHFQETGKGMRASALWQEIGKRAKNYEILNVEKQLIRTEVIRKAGELYVPGTRPK